MSHQFHFDVDLNVINHLGFGLYSSTPAALTELVANAWDAEADEVNITVDPANNSVVIEDDGHGMTPAEVQSRFLNVGYSRRGPKGTQDRTISGKRKVMGRKGIGKLSMFALAETLQISSQTVSTPPVGFIIDVPKFKESLANKVTTNLQEFSPKPLPKGHGTRIELTDLLKSIKTTESFLRVRLARRFSIIEGEDFAVKLNGNRITRVDRGFYEHVQFLWTFDDESQKDILPLCKNIAKLAAPTGSPIKGKQASTKLEPCVAKLPNVVKVDKKSLKIRGYIASVEQPKQLGSKEDSSNTIALFANGRVFSEDILPEANSAKYYQSYLVGEIHADFLDDDNVDRATASREAVKKDDPTYQAVTSELRTSLESISNQWDDWRIALGIDKSAPENAAIMQWLNSLSDNRDRKAATKLMTSIKNATIHSDEEQNAKAQAVLFRGAIVGFERLRLRKQLDRLDTLTDVLSPEFAAIFSGLDSLEETAYAEITQQRLKIINKFAKIADNPNTLERVAHKYLFKHLWLLDPAWDRVSGRADMEVDLTKYIKQVVPDSNGARLDISYRQSSGRHVVVELKKPGLKAIPYPKLYDQVRKYKKAVTQWYVEKRPGTPPPPLDIYVLVSKTPAGFDEEDRKSLAEQSGRFITYSELIGNAQNSYQAYMDAKKKTGKLEEILSKLGEE